MGGKRHLESPRVAAPTTISGRILRILLRILLPTPAHTPAPTPATPTNCTVKCTKAPRPPLPTQGPPRASPTAALAVRHAQAEARSSHASFLSLIPSFLPPRPRRAALAPRRRRGTPRGPHVDADLALGRVPTEPRCAARARRLRRGGRADAAQLLRPAHRELAEQVLRAVGAGAARARRVPRVTNGEHAARQTHHHRRPVARSGAQLVTGSGGAHVRLLVLCARVQWG